MTSLYERSESVPEDGAVQEPPRQPMSPLARLACWVAALAGVCLVTLSASPPRSTESLRILQTSLDLLPALAMLGAACYCWMRFHACRRVTWMFASLGFVAGSAFAVGHAAAVAFAARGSREGQLTADAMLTISRLAPAVLMAVAAYSSATVPASRTGLVAARGLIAALAGTAFALAGIAYLEYLAPRMLSAQFASPTAGLASQWRNPLASLQTAGLFAATGAYPLAALGYWRQAAAANDRAATVIVYWLAAMGLAVFLDAVAAREGSLLWISSGSIASLGAAFLILGFGVEGGAAYKAQFNRTVELQAMHAVTSALARTKDPSQTAQSLVEAVAEALQARMAALFLNTEERELTLAAAFGYDDGQERIGRRFELVSERRGGFQTSSTARAFRDQQIIVIPEAISECDFVPWRVAARMRGYVVCAPLVHGEKCLGVLDLLFPMELAHLAEREELFDMITGAAAPAIEAALEAGKTQGQQQTA